MARVHAESAASPPAQILLREYLAFRIERFPGGGYRPAPADPSAFVAPLGVFLILTDDNGGEVGCGGVRRIQIPGESGAVCFEIKHLYVRDSARGTGGGGMLLAALEQNARELGATDLVLDTHHSLDAAARLYARAGFAPIAAYNDNPNATVWLRKVLAKS
ncbi:GNAT superfamily N-acetyltransferase [Microbacterium halimionae]|uniref:GNAT superfamily N-acetyltransferase n=1 Tax=Microbacterium halimionae TaxID=1526413 RepID=A0A7W3PLB7_9MICO|nr:GNAT family N-acetyltransferase [Microbacterium halimionae]MBA8815831.1 GNAT superfamily N-acetyltransferase [Microbacterium halimionae]NII95877.1 GNAT superfamily N-acetyltransferase [Microbacterium halimionae]